MASQFPLISTPESLKAYETGADFINSEEEMALQSSDEPNTESNALAEAHDEGECESGHDTNMDMDPDFDTFFMPDPAPPDTNFETEIANTVKYVHFFADNSKDKHVVPIDIEPLTGKANYQEWAVKMECLLKLHQVWCTVDASIEPLYPGHEHYIWYQHMEAVAVSCVLAHVAPSVYEEMAHFSCQKNPVKLWYALWCRYGQ